MKPRALYTVMAVGGGLGVVASFLQTLEKLILLQDKNAIVPCNFNSVFNCSTVLNSWQSSLFGFPNSLICLFLFTTFAAVGLVGATGGTLARCMRLGIQALALFTLAFALWFLWQSVYSIGALCIFCIVCFGGLLMINWALLRLNAADLPFGRQVVQKLIAKSYDTLLWLGLGLVVALAMYIQFGL